MPGLYHCIYFSVCAVLGEGELTIVCLSFCGLKFLWLSVLKGRKCCIEQLAKKGHGRVRALAEASSTVSSKGTGHCQVVQRYQTALKRLISAYIVFDAK